MSVNSNTNQTNARMNTTLPSSILRTGEIVQLIIYMIILVVGCVGNTLVILYFGFKKKVKQRFSYYLINLAFVDLLTSLFTPVHFIYTIISQHQWQIGLLACIGLSSLGPLTVNVSSWIITSIAIERHRGIKNPLQQRYSRTRIYITMLFIWVISTATLIPYMMSLDIIYTNRTNNTDNPTINICRPEWPNPKTEFAYSLVLLVLQSILPTLMMIVMFMSIHKAVTARGRFLSVHYTAPTTSLRSSILRLQRHSSDERKTVTERRDKKLFNMLTIALVIFIVCSIPYNIFYTTLLYMVRITNTIPDVNILNVNIWLAMLVTINSCINFFIYAGMDKSFKAYCKSILFHIKLKEDNNAAQANRHQSFTSRLSINLESDNNNAVRRGSSIRFTRRRSSSNHVTAVQRLSYQTDETCSQTSSVQNMTRNSVRLSPIPIMPLSKANTLASPEKENENLKDLLN